TFDPAMLSSLNDDLAEDQFPDQDLSTFTSDIEAYYYLIKYLVVQQKQSTELVIQDSAVRRICVDGGFSKNSIYMNLLSNVFPEMEVFAASMAQATAMGTALAIHHSWNNLPVPNDLIELKFYSASHQKKNT